MPCDEAATFLRDWARRFLRPGQQLTTPVAVQDVDGGVVLRFLTRATGYADFGVEETVDEKWAATKPGAAEAKAGKPDGALRLTAEELPTPRVRVTRADRQVWADPPDINVLPEYGNDPRTVDNLLDGHNHTCARRPRRARARILG